MNRDELRKAIRANNRLEKIESFLQDLKRHEPKSAVLKVTQSCDLGDCYTLIEVDLKEILPLIKREKEKLDREIEAIGGGL